MKEKHYTYIGWGCFVLTALIALSWCLNRTGLMDFFLRLSSQLVKTELVQLSWLLTFATLCVPGWLLKNYFEAKAWDAHVRDLPPPDIRESAKRSKYVKLDGVPLAPPKPVQLANIPEGQEEFVATCPTCGHLFSARKSEKELKCPSCGEAVPLATKS